MRWRQSTKLPYLSIFASRIVRPPLRHHLIHVHQCTVSPARCELVRSEQNGSLAVRSAHAHSRACVDFLFRLVFDSNTRRNQYTHSNHTLPRPHRLFSTSHLELSTRPSNNTYRHKSRQRAAAVRSLFLLHFSSSFVTYISSIHSPSPAPPRLPLVEAVHMYIRPSSYSSKRGSSISPSR